MKNIQNFTATAGPVLSVLLATCTTTNLAMYTQFATNQPPYIPFSINRAIVQMQALRNQFDNKLLAQEVATCFEQCRQEGCTWGFMKKLAANYQKYSDNNELLNKANRKTTERLMDRKHSELHYEDDPNLPLWLWSEKRCNNPYLKKVVQLFCVDIHNIVTKTLVDLIKEN